MLISRQRRTGAGMLSGSGSIEDEVAYPWQLTQARLDVGQRNGERPRDVAAREGRDISGVYQGQLLAGVKPLLHLPGSDAGDLSDGGGEGGLLS